MNYKNLKSKIWFILKIKGNISNKNFKIVKENASFNLDKQKK